jgi:hypothetical protein
VRSSAPPPRLEGAPWGERRIGLGATWKADSTGALPPIPPAPPCLQEGSGAVSAPWADAPCPSPLKKEGGTGGTVIETPGNHGGNALPPEEEREGNGEERPTAPPGLAPRALPAPPDNPSRARIGPAPRYRASAPGSPARRSALPTRSESLPTGLRLIETPLPWSQGHIPATYLVPGLRRTRRYRTSACQPGEGVTAGGVVTSGGGGKGKNRGWPDNAPVCVRSGQHFRHRNLLVVANQ